LKAQSATTSITHEVTVAGGVFAPGHLGELTQYRPSGLAGDVLVQTRTVQRRLRALPSQAGACGLRWRNSLKIPDTGRNRAWIGKIRHRLGLASYPALRVMALARDRNPGPAGRHRRLGRRPV